MLDKKELEKQFNEDELIQLCQDLVRIPSENPPGDTREIAEFVYQYLIKYGLPAKIINPQKHMPNVVCTVEGEGDGPHLVFNGHMDTYPAGDLSNWSFDPFSAHISDGKIYGRGVADMKAGVSCSLYAFVLLAKNRSWPGKLSITLVSDEETGGTWGTEYLLKNHPDLRGDALLNGEPSAVQMVSIGEKGHYWIKLKAKNKGGHGAYIFQRQSAVDDMLNCIEDLREYEELTVTLPESLRDALRDTKPVFDELRGNGSTEAAQAFSLNIGIIDGGMNVNTQAESCEAFLDFRVPPGGNLQQAKDFINNKLKNHPNIEMELIKETEPTITMPSNPLFKAVKANADAVTKENTVPCFTFGLTDARYWRLHGVPAVVYGPNHYNMGSSDEHVEINDLISAGKVHLLASWDYLNLNRE